MELILNIGYIAALLAAFERIRQVMREGMPQFNGTTILFTAVGALLIDRVVIAAGSLLGEGELLAGLNLGRLWLGAMVPPLLIVTYVEFTGRLKVRGARTKTVSAVVWGLAWLIFGLQVWHSATALTLDGLSPVQSGGLLYYVPQLPLTAPGTVAANTVGLVFALFILLRSTWPLPLIGIGLVWLESVLFPQPFIVAQGIEVIWIWTLVLTDWWAQKIGLRIDRGELDNRLDRLG
ncbi:MAG TPA: hypothetical protein VMN57_00855 [Anaerolineales bacterium]|nr:hypothetical protein [Anaerolineales bacterium]